MSVKTRAQLKKNTSLKRVNDVKIWFFFLYECKNSHEKYLFVYQYTKEWKYETLHYPGISKHFNATQQ